ncbi:MAG: diaminopimelate decarboxylase [Desulfurococcales archaeon]|nr:diaminopimelate decarboxylase [Desulfurococcales archaeon]
MTVGGTNTYNCNDLGFDGVNLIDEVVEVYGSPVYIYSGSIIEARASEVKLPFKGLNIDILYSMKANSNPYIVKFIYDQGLGIETTSPGEVYIALRAGVPPEKIYFLGNSVSREDLSYIVNWGVNINVDSIQSIQYLCELGYSGEIGLRINPLLGSGYHPYTITGGLESKFGVLPSEVSRAFSLASSCNIAISRLHSHVGSGIQDPKVYLSVLEALSELAKRLPSVDELDIGGGFAVPYKRGEPRFPWSEFAGMLTEAVERLGLEDYKLIIEPGRYIVAESGLLLARVTDVKVRGRKLIVGVDTGMNHLVRPALYGAYHEVIVVNKACMEGGVIADIVGNICESSDVLARNRLLPRIEVGDVVAFMNAGAYGYSMASNYNLRLLPPEVFIYKGKARLIRRRQRFDDLYSLVVIDE